MGDIYEQVIGVHINFATDMWSIGCIYAEQLTIKPLFSVDNMVHQLERMIDFLGTPIESPGRYCHLQYITRAL